MLVTCYIEQILTWFLLSFFFYWTQIRCQTSLQPLDNGTVTVRCCCYMLCVGRILTTMKNMRIIGCVAGKEERYCVAEGGKRLLAQERKRTFSWFHLNSFSSPFLWTFSRTLAARINLSKFKSHIHVRQWELRQQVQGIVVVDGGKKAIILFSSCLNHLSIQCESYTEKRNIVYKSTGSVSRRNFVVTFRIDFTIS